MTVFKYWINYSFINFFLLIFLWLTNASCWEKICKFQDFWQKPLFQFCDITVLISLCYTPKDERSLKRFLTWIQIKNKYNEEWTKMLSSLIDAFHYGNKKIFSHFWVYIDVDLLCKKTAIEQSCSGIFQFSLCISRKI